MYTNELLEEKYRTQKELYKISKNNQKVYLEMLEHYIKNFYKEKNWNLVYSKRQGGFEEQDNPQKAVN